MPDSSAHAGRTAEVAHDFLRHLLSERTATRALASWSAPRLGPQAGVGVRVLAEGPCAASDYPGLEPMADGEPLHYRRVELLWGEQVVSEAENWYWPARLDGAAERRMAAGVPFGRAVEALQPRRTLLGWYIPALDGRSEEGDRRLSPRWLSPAQGALDARFLLHVHASMRRAGGPVICEVREHYRTALAGGAGEVPPGRDGT